ncbi:hypothetical protein C8N40_10392 [Pontibacter mucosus]|uniref:Uncharacterized protein n=1 Tax=Pontibacter mucosus TaxID=1649266 RepID=A0A2T5YL15_9BACT|nr:hypothetical protein [Pontibacter mucosus]PTX20020.1 hypothetical protein C8N40_10392 [Pontibacter mucosus]
MNERDLGLLEGMIGRLSSDLNMVKAFSHVALREISKLPETEEYQSLIKDVEGLHAQNVLDTDKVFKELLSYTINPDQRDFSLDELLNK